MAKKENKPFPPSKACATKCLYAIMKYMKENGGNIAYKNLSDFLQKNVQLTDWEKERSGKMQYYRWWATTQFYSVDYAKAGFILKKDGVWYLTTEGESALKLTPEEIMTLANEAYHKWKKQKDAEENPEDIENEEEKENTVNLEDLCSIAKNSISSHIRGKNPYEFQDMVAALLRAMGYYTPFIAPKGKDGGVDIIAYLDALGAKTPRIKVQVKHYPDNPIGADAVRSLRGVLDDEGDIGLFVTSGSFSSAARQETMKGTKKFIKLIDGDELINLWEAYYDKMADEDKNMLPLKKISFLGTNE